MRLRKKLGLIGVASALVLVPVLWIGGASAATHGIGFQKGCNSPTKVGDPVVCHYTITNNNFTNASLDTVTINSLADVTHAAAGDTPPTNILGNLELFKTFGNATCTASSGTGTFADPWIGTTSCTLPGGNVVSGPRLGLWSEIQSKDHNGYVVQPADYNIDPVNHSLANDAKLGWQDVCDIDPPSCNTGQQTATAPSATLLQRRVSQTATDIHNAAHQIVTTVGVGTAVHDFITATSTDPDPGNPIPHGGNVLVEWFTNGTCNAPAAASATVGPVDATGHFEATGFSQTPLTAGHYAFRAHYLGDGTYDGSDGACEPLTVVDANIQITPNGTNRVGATHTFTAHVNVNNGNGSTNAPDGTQISFTIDSGPGAFTSANPCTTGGGTGSCQITLSSAVTGVTTVSAHTTVSVGGVSLTRDTNGVGANSGPAVKTWVNARIHITPNATNAVGQPHTFTVLLEKDTGNGAGFVAAGGETVTVTLTPAGGATPSPAGPFTGTTNAAGQFQVTFTSPTTGTVTGHASSTLSVAGSAPFTVATDGVAPNGPDAVKTFVNANIQITPANASNPVGTNHVLTITVNALGGTIDAGPHTATASIVSGPGSFVGPNTCTYTGGAATASCTVTITSAAVGTTVVSATSDIPVNGVTITRTTNTAVNTAAGGSGNANKVWVNANIQITPANATNPVGTNHVLTITVNALGGTIDAGPHTATASIVSGPGSFVGPNTCTYSGGAATASCTVTITSAVVGTTVVSATSDIPVNGIVITRTTNTAVNTAAGGSGNANKSWVDANIQITPANANNPVGTNHVLTITVNALGGTIDAGPHTATASIVSGPGSFVGSPTCTYTGGAATASCTVTITSAVAGTTVVSATSNIPVGGVTITRTTGTAVNTAAGGSGNANKNWSDDVVATHVRNAANQDITNQTVQAGTVVHDEATVSKAAGTPAALPDPTGTVTFTLFNNGTCNGAVLATDPNKPLVAGTATSVTFTTPAVNASFSYLAHYNGDANYPAHNGPCEPFSVTSPQGQITPTQVECSDFASGTAPTLTDVFYKASGGVIGQSINPGVFFFWTKITTTVPNQVVTISQSNNSTNNAALFLVHQGWDRLYKGDCSSYKVGTEIAGGSGASFTVLTPGTYNIGVKYSTKSIAGTTAPVPANIIYSFTTSLGGSTGATVNLTKQ